MILHYFKIAFRNLLKYKTQSVISIVGLAVGFTCFALANLWIHYEMTYDSAAQGSDCMYLLYQKNALSDTGYSTNVSYPLSTLLKETFPEVEATCVYNHWQENELQVEGQPLTSAISIQGDSCLMNMFGIKVLSGSMEFMYSDDKIALTEDMAIRLFGTTDVLGKEVKTQGSSVTVCAILNGVEHSNLSFDFWEKGAYYQQWNTSWQNINFKIIIRLRSGVEFAEFQKKLNENKHKVDPRNIEGIFEGLLLMPLQQYQYSDVNSDKPIRFTYLILFSVAGGLVILCSLFNYLSLFVTRMRMRSREMELRKVCGSSGSSLFSLFVTEYLMVLLASGLVGMTLLEVSLPMFREMSKVTGAVYGESSLFFVGVAALSLLLLIPFVISRSRPKQRGENYWLRKSGIIFQLITGILFMFCMSVLMKQLYFLKNTDLGWERKDIAAITYIYPNDQFEEIGDKVEKRSSTREVLKGHWGLLPRGAVVNLFFKNWDGKQDSAKNISIATLLEGEELAKFYNLKLLKGEMLKKGETNKVMMNETAAKALGMHDPVGKNLYWGNKGETALTICALIKDFHITPPTTPVQPTLFAGEGSIVGKFFGGKGQILIKYHEGQWSELKTNIEGMFVKEYPDIRYMLVNVEDKYAEYLKSEDALLKLLGFVSGVCVLIAIFGIFSLVTLSCERRRKEIAVRKVNGATVKKILYMFVKEYMVLLSVASVIAFPLGYVLMKQWLQSYVEQTEISLWIYLAIFGFIALFILLSIGWRVWQAARQNPAEVIKND